MQRRRESTSSSVKTEETCVSKKIDETVRLQFKKRVNARNKKRPQGIAVSRNSAPRLANLSAASFVVEMNPETYCSLTVQPESEDRMARMEQSQEREMM